MKITSGLIEEVLGHDSEKDSETSFRKSSHHLPTRSCSLRLHRITATGSSSLESEIRDSSEDSISEEESESDCSSEESEETDSNYKP